MNLTPYEWFTLASMPGRLTTTEMEMTVGIPSGSGPIIIQARLIRPLGNPPANGPKFFGRDYVLSLCKDEKWLAKVSNALVKHWQRRNSRKKMQQTVEDKI